MEVGCKAQAMVIDALFFLLICGSCAYTLIWAANAYGNNSFRTYTFIYMSEYDSSLLNVLSKASYDVDGTERYWLDEVGKYMQGEFNESSSRYPKMMEEWHTFCLHAPHPVQLSLEADTEQPVKYDELYFACPFDDSDVTGYNTTDWVKDYRKGLCPLDEQGIPVACNASSGTPSYSWNYTCPYDAGMGEVEECFSSPPLYSSGIQRKLCWEYVCRMEAKIYY